MRSLAVFCGSKSGNHSVYAQMAIEVAQALVARNIRLIYGGGDVGLMGVIAKAVLNNNGKVTGVMPKFLQEREGHFEATDYIIVDTMHERKAIMAEHSEGFLILPGGYGTMDEFMEIITWRQLGLHNKPIGVFNINGYYNHVLLHLDQMVKEGFLSTNHRKLVLHSLHLNLLLDKMEKSVISLYP